MEPLKAARPLPEVGRTLAPAPLIAEVGRVGGVLHHRSIRSGSVGQSSTHRQSRRSPSSHWFAADIRRASVPRAVPRRLTLPLRDRDPGRRLRQRLGCSSLKSGRGFEDIRGRLLFRRKATLLAIRQWSLRMCGSRSRYSEASLKSRSGPFLPVPRALYSRCLCR
jgi:hypothetical protein